MRTLSSLAVLTLLASSGACGSPTEEEVVGTSSEPLHDGSFTRFLGVNASETYSSAGGVDRANAFFQPLGTNGRSCGTCHQVDQGWSITPAKTRALFDATDGTDVLFNRHDVATSPTADVSTVEARREAYKLLLSRGVVRVGMAVPATAEFEIVEIDDPYGFATASAPIMFRRPPPVSNLKFASTVNWDGRTTLPGKTPVENLTEHANRAHKNHGQTTVNLTPEQAAEIVAFETSTFSAQGRFPFVGDLALGGGQGGAENLATMPFVVDMNTGEGADAHSMTLYDAWSSASSVTFQGRLRSILARGARVFGEARLKTASGNMIACSTCHNTPNVGTSSVMAAMFDVGVSDASRRSADVPLYTFRNKTTGETRKVTDAGRAHVTGLWADIGKFKVPNVRDLVARPPYFHDGSAATLEEVVDHYRARFDMNLSNDDRSALLAFLRAL